MIRERTVDVTWEAGTLSAIARDASGQLVAQAERKTNGKAVALKLSIDAPSEATGTGSAIIGRSFIFVPPCSALFSLFWRPKYEKVGGTRRNNNKGTPNTRNVSGEAAHISPILP